MGQKLIQSKNTADVDYFLYKYYSNLQFEKLYNNGILSKTALVINKTENAPLIIKIFFTINYEENDKKEFNNYIQQLLQYNKIIEDKKILNYTPIIKIEKNELAGLIIRQYFGYNLRERMFQMPYLTKIEKLWLIYQLLFSLNELHSNEIIHGDLKMENILLTSYNSLFLTDISPYKPAHLEIDNIILYTYFFGSVNKSCYLSPERILNRDEYNEKKNNEDFNKLNCSMDIFSAGIIICELLTEIQPFFLLNELWEFKYGKIDINDKLSNLNDEKLKDLLLKMLEIDPSKRINSKDALNYFIENICPIFINGFQNYYNTLIYKTCYWKPDLIIGFFFRYWESVWKLIFGLNEKIPIIEECLNYYIINKLYLEQSTFEIQQFFENKNLIFILDLKENKIININNINDEIINNENSKECILLIFNYIVEAMQNVKYESSNWVALEMIKCIIKKVPDNIKLFRIIPYFINNLQRNNLLTQLKSLNLIIDSLLKIDYINLKLPREEYYYFHGYIFPYIIEVIRNNYKKENLLIAFINLIGDIIDIESKFLNIMMKDKLKYLNNELNKKNDINIDDIKGRNQKEKEKELLKIKKKKEEEKLKIFRDFHKTHEEFKHSLFSLIRAILRANLEEEVLVEIFNNLPKILKLYNGEELNEFKRQTLSYINSRKSKIQTAILKNLSLMTSFSKKDFENIFLPCLELIFNDNDEIKIVELFNLINNLLEKDFIGIQNLIDALETYFSFISHPNILIRKKVLIFAKILIKKNKINNLINYYDKILCFKESIFNINEDVIEKYHKKSLSRILFQIGEEYNYSKLNIKETDEYMNNLNEMIEILQGRNINFFPIINEVIETKKPIIIEKQQVYSFFEFINNFLKLKTKSTTEADLLTLFYPITDSRQLILKKYHSNKEITFNGFDEFYNILYWFYFKIFYLLKVLNIPFSGFTQEYFNKDNTSEIKEEELFIQKTKHKNFQNWRPQGQLLTTIYNKSTNPIEKIIPFDNTKFLSIDNKGEITLREIEIRFDDLYIKNCLNLSNNEYSIKFNSTILKIGKDIIFASNNSLILFEFKKKTSEKIYSIEENEYITLCQITKLNLTQINFLFTDTKLRIHLFDLKNKKCNLIYKIPLEKGFIFCSCQNSNDENEFLFGTSIGLILNLSLKLNSITHIYEFDNKKPILGIRNFKPNINSILDINNNNYYIINFGNENHDIKLINFNNLNCEIIMSVSKNLIDDRNEIDYPILTKSLFEDNSLLNLGKYYFEKLSNDIEIDSENKFYYYNSILKKNRFIQANSLLDYFNKENIDNRFDNIKSLYDYNSNIQKIFSPSYESLNNYYNTNFIISVCNDHIIRYWDISKSILKEKKSYIINAPNNFVNCYYSQSYFNKSLLLIQSNEYYGDSFNNNPEYNYYGEYQFFNNLNIINCKNGKFNYIKRIVEASHKNIITDIQYMELNQFLDYENDFPFILLTSSWDGNIKIWK